MDLHSRWSSLLFICGIFGCIAAQSSQSKVMRIDNSDIYSSSNLGGIQYTQGWSHLSNTGPNPPYNNTISATLRANASAVLFFKGNSIAYYTGTSEQVVGGYANVDGILEPIPGSSTTTGLRNPIWSKSGLDQGDHFVVISRSNETASYNFSLDYFEITYNDDIRPSSLAPGSIDAPSELVAIVDDLDDRIIYRGPWKTWSGDLDIFYYGGTATNSNETESSLSFSFNGTAIWYFCDKYWTNAKVLIRVDGGEGEVVSTALAYSDKDRWFSQAVCWSKTDLPDGLHTLNIAHQDEAGKWFSVDFLAYASIPTPSHKSKTPLGAVVGGAVGGGVGVLLIIAIICWLYRRRKAPVEADPSVLGTETGTKHSGTQSPLGSPTAAALSYRSEQWSPVTMVSDPNTNKGSVERTSQWSTQQYPRLPEPYAA